MWRPRTARRCAHKCHCCRRGDSQSPSQASCRRRRSVRLAPSLARPRLSRTARERAPAQGERERVSRRTSQLFRAYSELSWSGRSHSGGLRVDRRRREMWVAQSDAVHQSVICEHCVEHFLGDRRQPVAPGRGRALALSSARGSPRVLGSEARQAAGQGDLPPEGASTTVARLRESFVAFELQTLTIR